MSDKGQIAIPIDLRKDIDIKSGDKLMVLKRKDSAGITLIKLSAVDSIMLKIQEDDDFISKVK